MEIKSIGIWGFGIVGKSATDYFHQLGMQVDVLDKRNLAAEERNFLAERGIPVYGPDSLTQFLEHNDAILPSPGIDLRPYAHYRHKWIAELDLFARNYHRPIIAVTGSIGKTSVTHLLSTLLQAHGVQLATGGNIGTAMLDLLKTSSSLALLEVSSFQLELCKSFAPDLALWTNCFPNHLDRHTDYAEYVDAKYTLLKYQQAGQQALVPLTLYDEIKKRGFPRSTVAFFSPQKPSAPMLKNPFAFYYYHNGNLMVEHQGTATPLIAVEALPPLSFLDNWLIICGALHMLSIPLDIMQQAPLALPEHRLEKVATIAGIEFYNDSKSTTAISTAAAIKTLSGKPIHLFLGGLGKGVDRTPLIQELKKYTIAHVYCFGKEADILHSACGAHAAASSAHATLEDAFDACAQAVRGGDIVLFSPSGSSYDLFQNYMERGTRFKELVRAFAALH